MSKTTLLFISRDRVVRANFKGGSSQPVSVVQRARPETDDPQTLVSTVCSQDSPRLGRVFVLSTDFWVNTIDIPAVIIGGMSQAELPKLLTYEAEPLSGIPAFDAAAAVVPLGEFGENRRFWLTEATGTAREEFDEAIRRSGGTLAGLCHPAGVPLPLATSNVGAWQRTERWPGLTVRVAWQDGRLSALEVDSGQAANRERAESAQRTGAAKGLHEEALFSEDPPADVSDRKTAAIHLAEEKTLAEWLGHWHQALAQRKRSVPVIGPLVRPLSNRQRMMIAACLAALVGLACFGHDRLIAKQKVAAAEEEIRLLAPGKEMVELKKQMTKLETDVKAARLETDKLANQVEPCERAMADHRLRLSRLLEQLSKAPGEGWILQKIDGDGNTLKLHGLAVHPGRIGTLANELAAQLEQVGWTVDPPQQKAQSRVASGAPWRFELSVREIFTPRPLPQPESEDGGGGTTALQLSAVKAP